MFKDKSLYQLFSTNKEGNTALHIAVIQGDIKMIEFLLASGANPNICNLNLTAPLPIATFDLPNTHPNRHFIIWLLLVYGANPNTQRKFKKSPINDTDVLAM